AWTLNIFSSNFSGSYHKVKGFAVSNLLPDTIQRVFLCQACPHSLFGLTDAISVFADLARQFVIVDLYVLRLGYLVEYKRSAHFALSPFALPVANGLPVDLQKARVHSLPGHLPEHRLHPRFNLLLDDIFRNVESVSIDEFFYRS